MAINFLGQHLLFYQKWGEETNPQLGEGEEIKYENTLLAYNFPVKPYGHILVPARDEFSPILLYSFTSNFNAAHLKRSGDYVEKWIIPELYHTYQSIVSNLSGPKRTINYHNTRVGQAWKFIENVELDEGGRLPEGPYYANIVGPLLATTWGQGTPYNNSTPGVSGSCDNTVTGCVATAWAQIMYYWQWPASGTGSSSYTWEDEGGNQILTADYNHTYDWSNMLSSYSSSYSDTQAAAVATLMSDVGVSMELNYGCTGTSGAVSIGMTALPNYFKYEENVMDLKYRGSYGASEWMNLIRAELDAQFPRPMFFAIYSSQGGHAVVIDGYQTGSTDSIHLNMGWTGPYDGFYDITNNFTTGSFVWSANSQYVITGIYPNSNWTATYTDLALSSDSARSTSDENEVIINVTVTNQGSEIARGVSIAITLPESSTYKTYTATQGSYNGGNGLWTTGTINVGATATISVSATVLRTGNLTASAQKTASTPFDNNRLNDFSHTTFNLAKTDKKGCFMATAVFDSPKNPNVIILQNFKRKYLLTNYLGKKIIDLYYKYSPRLALKIKDKPLLKKVIKLAFYPIIGICKILNSVI